LLPSCPVWLDQWGRSPSWWMALVNDGIKVITIKEGMALNGKRDMKAKVMLTMFSLFAEIERDLVSERTKEGLKRARAEGG